MKYKKRSLTYKHVIIYMKYYLCVTPRRYPFCAGGLWLQGHCACIATLLHWQYNSLCALLISRPSYVILETTHLLKILKLILPPKIQLSPIFFQSIVFNISMFYDVMSCVLIPTDMWPCFTHWTNVKHCLC